jgi:hypothetical protein
MILYYAVGGGLGHLTRARRVLERLGLQDEAAIVTATPDARDKRITGGIAVVEIPPHLDRSPEACRTWLHDLVREHRPERLLVDVFPGGIQGELCGLDACPMDYVARLLRWDEYRRAVPAELPRFATTYVVEELTPPHAAFVREHSEVVVTLKLAERVPTRPPGWRAISPPSSAHFWLIVHSGPESEVRELVAYTSELRALDAAPPRVIVAARSRFKLPDGFEHADTYPASPLFEAATRVISAAGFNVMLEMEPWREKHAVVPFARRFDDQHLRAARRKARS